MSSCRVTVIADQNFIHLKLSGTLSGQIFSSVTREVISHFDETRHKGMLVDAVELEFSFSMGDIYFNAAKCAKAGFTRIPRWAIVNKSGDEEADRFRELVGQNMGMNARLLYSIEDARNWILDQD